VDMLNGEITPEEAAIAIQTATEALATELAE
jgi:hypothetical protein